MLTSVDEVKAQAQPLAYSAMARDPSKYLGAIVKLRGQVVQVMEEGNGCHVARRRYARPKL
jgi:hypothetical protein